MKRCYPTPPARTGPPARRHQPGLAKPSHFDSVDVMTELTREARDKGANTLLVASDDARTGTAYLCTMPSQTAQSNHSGGSK